MLGCGGSLKGLDKGPSLDAQLDTLRSHLHAAGSLGAMACAPKVFAQVHAAYRFATLERNQGNRVRAWEHVEEGLRFSAEILESSKDCPVRGVLVENQKMDPGADSDGDGIATFADACPYALEDLDDFEDEDGCPDPDNDGDGVLDAEDQCALEHEDLDGFEDEDGCPEPDNDGDGVLDVDDLCADEAETLNGFEDDDGCADILPKRLDIVAGYIELDAAVQFVDEQGSELLAASLPMLEGLAAQLLTRPSLIIRVEGHTSNRGSSEELLARSKARAKSVADFLIEQGLAEARVLHLGLGGTQPKTTNRTKSGRRLNERIEFAVIGGQ
tara:strand:+ start:53 stop:1036 length:984 start_codon:yes stop_codon:yes gene_type:complete